MRGRSTGISAPAGWIVWLVLGFQTAAWAAGIQLKSVDLQKPAIELYERCELTIHVDGSAKNPYDLDEVNVEATFQPLRGQPVVVPAFYYQDFKSVTEQGKESIQPAGDPVWKVRFTPRQTGLWSYAVKLTTPKGTQSLPGGRFEVAQSTRRGFVQLDRGSPYFRFDNGRTFVPIGENLCWGPSVQPLTAYNRWLKDLAKQRANYIRVWMAPWGFRLETKDTGVGRYDQLRAWQVDALLEQSEKMGLYWQLSLLDHGSLSQAQDPDWQNNPYNEALGGMCRLPGDFATDPRARRKFKQLLRYIVSRWGYSPQLVSWELFNEIDLSGLQSKDFVPWVTEMSGWLHATDVNRRPVTISFHKVANGEAVWAIPTIDTIQIHLYDQRDFAETFAGPMIAKLWQTHRKPVMVGEFGWITDFVRQVDLYGIHLHDGLWASVMGGAAGGGLIWYWDVYIHPNHLERHFRPLAEFWRGEQLGQRVRRLEMSFSDKTLLGAGIGTPDRAYLWIKNGSHNVDQFLAYRCEIAKQAIRKERGQAPRMASYPPRIVRNATATVRGLGSGGRYRLEWWDPYYGRILSSSVAQVRGGQLVMELPELAFDVAAKLIKLHWWEQG